MCLHLPRGAEVLVPAYTYMATATCILRAGLTPVFVDIHENTYNIDPGPARVRRHRPDPAPSSSSTSADSSCDMDAVLAVAAKHDLRVVEDSAHAHGATWKNRGLGTIGDVGCFSFQASKNLNAGEGGMLLTNDAQIYTRAIEYHDLWAGGMLEREGQLGQGSMRSGATWDYPVAASSNRMPSPTRPSCFTASSSVLEEQTERFAPPTPPTSTTCSTISKASSPRRQDDWVTRDSRHLYICRYDA